MSVTKARAKWGECEELLEHEICAHNCFRELTAKKTNSESHNLETLGDYNFSRKKDVRNVCWVLELKLKLNEAQLRLSGGNIPATVILKISIEVKDKNLPWERQFRENAVGDYFAVGNYCTLANSVPHRKAWEIQLWHLLKTMIRASFSANQLWRLSHSVTNLFHISSCTHTSLKINILSSACCEQISSAWQVMKILSNVMEICHLPERCSGSSNSSEFPYLIHNRAGRIMRANVVFNLPSYISLFFIDQGRSKFCSSCCCGTEVLQ